MTFLEEKGNSLSPQKSVHIPLISVVMGTYNGGKYLREQLESIYSQTYKNIEVIVCDDCSTDNTVEILKDFSRKFGLKYYLNETNLGLVKNYEKVLSLANGDYLALADQDDIWYPGKIELLLNNIGSSSLIHSAVHVIDDKGRPHGDAYVVSEYSRDHTQKINFTDFLETAWVLGCTSLIQKSLLEKSLPFPEGVMFHDWWLTMAAIKLGHGIKYIHEPTIKYRQHGENTAFKFFIDGSWHKKRFEFYKLLASKFSGLLSTEEKEKLNTITYQNALCYIMPGILGNHIEPVEQFLIENRDLFTVSFIQEMSAFLQSDIKQRLNVGNAEQITKDYFSADPAYQFIHILRSKIYAPVSRKDKFLSKLYKGLFKPLLLNPIRKIYHLIRSRA